MDEGCDARKKRARDDSEDSLADPPDQWKLIRLNRDNLPVSSPEMKWIRDSSNNSMIDSPAQEAKDGGGTVMDSPQAKAIQDHLLSVLEDPEGDVIQGLDSVIKSFEEEIKVPEAVLPAAELTSVSGESHDELGFLLEASDYQLGLPSTADSGKENGEIEANGFPRATSFILEAEIPSYDGSEFEPVAESVAIRDGTCSGEAAAFNGCLDLSDGPDEYLSRPSLR